MAELPRSVDELTPAWLTEVLRRRFPETRVEGMEIIEVIRGVGTKVRIHAKYADEAVESCLPCDLCVKGALDSRWRAKYIKTISKCLGADPAAPFLLEARFYEHMTANAAIPLPRCFFAGADGAGQGIVVLDDLVAAEVSFGDPTRPWPTDRVASALGVLAALHAATWGGSLRDYPWLPRSTVLGDFVPVLLSAPHWKTHFLFSGSPTVPAELDDRRRILSAMKALVRQHQNEAVCVTHGDAHIANTYIDRDGSPLFLDWQTVCLGAPMDDVAYFMTGALSISDRRAHERDLISHYLDALARRGAPAPEADVAWNAYRRYALHGFGWVMWTPPMQPWRNVRAMSERHIAAILDLDSIQAVNEWRG
ncbi:phosphotransferase [Mycobacterium sp. E2733]|uniref:aminoglycoside phosphotransferase family protein n=1 Tax=Mycobacterium sp. E2733 TaxID=1834138 RepID=UPI0009EE16D7|nr:phosphotransferase [Mycobacterium sp. E2733]